MRARISLESPQGSEPLYADVSVVDSVIDAPSGTFGVRISLPNPDHQVPSGQRCRVSFEPRTASSRTQIPTY
jgi:multidrug efflux pump subunit AcrA (membrane-fusion protein)